MGRMQTDGTVAIIHSRQRIGCCGQGVAVSCRRGDKTRMVENFYFLKGATRREFVCLVALVPRVFAKTSRSSFSQPQHSILPPTPPTLVLAFFLQIYPRP
jgi:hypothetical protein